MDALRSHGHSEAALRLAVAVVRTMKQQQLQAQRDWHESRQLETAAGTSSGSSSTQEPKPCTSRCQGACTNSTSTDVPTNQQGWVGHQLDPIGCLFDTLAEASTISDDQRPRTPSYLDLVSMEQPSNLRPRYQHVSVVGSRDRSETYLTLAFEVALIGLGQQRLMPVGMYAQVS